MECHATFLHFNNDYYIVLNLNVDDCMSDHYDISNVHVLFTWSIFYCHLIYIFYQCFTYDDQDDEDKEPHHIDLLEDESVEDEY